MTPSGKAVSPMSDEKVAAADIERSASAGPQQMSIHSDDPRIVTMLSTEHWSVLSARSLAYNEAFTRAGMFLSFLSMSFVALALVAQAMAFSHDFLLVASLVLAFDFLIGLVTVGRVIGVGHDDLRAMHGMNRLRHGYVEIAPVVAPYFTTGIHDDLASVMIGYGSPPERGLSVIVYGLTTS